MADRIRSKDGTRETEAFVGDADTPSQQGRAGGGLERDVGTRAEKERAEQGEGITRVRKGDEIDHGKGSAG